MYDDLYEFFVLNGHLSLPGIGTFSLEKKPATADIANRVIQPPANEVVFSHAALTPTKTFFTWLAEKQKISYSEAIVGFNAFAYDLRTDLLSGMKITWPRLGILSKGIGNEIVVEPAKDSFATEASVPAVKVIRENAQHTIRVGEEERTSAEMEEILQTEGKGRSEWIWPAVIIAAVSIAAMLFFFSSGGPGTGNQKKLDAQEGPSLHRVIG